MQQDDCCKIACVLLLPPLLHQQRILSKATRHPPLPRALLAALLCSYLQPMKPPVALLGFSTSLPPQTGQRRGSTAWLATAAGNC